MNFTQSELFLLTSILFYALSNNKGRNYRLYFLKLASQNFSDTSSVGTPSNHLISHVHNCPNLSEEQVEVEDA